ncbi:DUF3971 domain-containing protein [Nereida sp. MMG025]|uniref:YhdP family protein n=1 Tax=Nereida sp. MMG025 TaxID=2909981 RepID=UPI001F2E3FC0|nr:DUF3971 domain-containing protein [Nereida sp. MMG025]MCF6443642.1 DUF3971 domain-containing protein [Nereida sp. MMG025]
MNDETSAQGAPEEVTQPNRPRRAWFGVRAVQLFFSMLVLFCVGLVLAVVVSIDRPIPAPDWLKAQVQSQLSDALENGDVEIGEISVVLDRELHTHIQLQDIRLAFAETGTVARLADVRIDLLRRALPRGEIKAKRVELTGLQMNLRRDEEGRFNVSFGEDTSAVRALQFGDFINEINSLFSLETTQTIDAVVVEGVTLRYVDALSGQVLVADGGRITAEQDRQGIRLRTDIAVLSGGVDVTTMEITYEAPRQPDGVTSGGTVGVNLVSAPAQLIASQVPAMAWLSVLDAPLSGAMRFDLDTAGTIGTVFATLDISQGSLSPQDGARPIRFEGARTYFTYDPAAQSLSFDELALRSDTLSALASGTAYLGAFQDGFPQDVVGQFQFSELVANPEGLFRNAPTFKDAAIDFRLALDPFTLDIGDAFAIPDLGETDAPVLRTKGKVAVSIDGWSVALDTVVERIAARTVMDLWPANAKPQTRAWFDQNLLGGEIFNAGMALRLIPNAEPVVESSFEFSDANVRFMAQMPPIEGGAGFATLQGERFVLALDKGFVTAPRGGRIQIAGSDMRIANLFMRDPPAEIRLKTDSTITAALSLIDQEPLQLMRKNDQPVDLADGRARLDVDLSLPLAEKIGTDDVDYAVRGLLQQVTTTKLIEDRTLTAQALNIQVAPQGMSVEGGVLLSRLPAEVRWSQQFDGSRTSALSADVVLDERFLDTFNIALPDGALRGAGRARLTASLEADGGGSYQLRSDLGGVRLSIPALSWRKGRNQTGTLEVDGRFGTPPRIDRLVLRAAGLDAQGTITVSPNGGLQTAQFNRLRVGNWLDAPVTLTGRGVGATPAVQIRGGTLDLRQTSLGTSGGNSDGGPITLALDRLILSDGITLTNMRGDLSTRGAFNGKFRGQVNGGAAITGTLVPGPQGTAIRIQSSDAGAAARGANLLRQARGGTLDLTLQPTGAEGTYDGVLKVTNTRVFEAPALASLLNAISVIGLLDQMGSGGILFTSVDASFRLSPSNLTVFSSSATGPSIGLSMDGRYRLADGAMDMQGVVSPLYALNGIGQIFTRRGEGLIGFNFTLRGSSSQPRVVVNPLSVFTPGMFREIFRRAPPQRN